MLREKRFYRFLIPSLIGAFLFVTPINQDGNLTIPIAVAANGLLDLMAVIEAGPAEKQASRQQNRRQQRHRPLPPGFDHIPHPLKNTKDRTESAQVHYNIRVKKKKEIAKDMRAKICPHIL